ncbi:hypothetical protein J6590_047183 [Homalodisca vitripennis]|nr:hypothetical protein J6590_047183 [Homalodisca vitripennis]
MRMKSKEDVKERVSRLFGGHKLIIDGSFQWSKPVKGHKLTIDGSFQWSKPVKGHKLTIDGSFNCQNLPKATR